MTMHTRSNDDTTIADRDLDAALADDAATDDAIIQRTIAAIAAIDRDDAFSQAIDAALDAKTKPPGSLGDLERLAAQIARVQRRLDPRIEHAQTLVFAGDHGVAAAGVSAYPAAVTAQMVANFLAGGAAICVLSRQFGAELTVVDAGVAADIEPHPRLLARKIGYGTASFAEEPAMSASACAAALRAGIAIGSGYSPYGALILGEMGIGNTTSAATLMHTLTGLPVGACVGRGTGIDDAALVRKTALIEAAVAKIGAGSDALESLRCFGGFEIAMMCGAMLGAGAKRQLVIVDGFIATAAAAVALALAPALRDYCIFAHVSAESPHRRWLDTLGVRPLLDLNLRLGEGSGAILALPLLHASAAILREMATFASAGVSDRDASKAPT
jgi:nicotinate-nucleotide--dimethylbenzimidazole phosphoribosyltransferase